MPRECLAIGVSGRLTGEGAVERLSDGFVKRGTPKQIRSDNGPEVTTRRVCNWLDRVGVRTLSVEPGRPRENGVIEFFNGKPGDELLHVQLCDTLREAGMPTERCRRQYNRAHAYSFGPPAPEAVLSAT